jgi:hypothetical protein
MAKKFISKYMMTYILLGTIGISICIIITMVLLSSGRAHTKANGKHESTPRNFKAPVLGHASSSIDSERQFSENTQWKGQPSKCYDCESDMANRYGDAAVFDATKQKLFDAA